MFENLLQFIPLVKGIISLFIIVDPFGNIPIFISLTEKMNKEEKSFSNGHPYRIPSPLILRFSRSANI